MQPAAEVGGDYYDFKLENDGTLTAAIGDATGHGLQAGIMVATVKGLFNSLAHEPDLVRILQKSSAAINAMGFPRLYIYDGEICKTDEAVCFHTDAISQSWRSTRD